MRRLVVPLAVAAAAGAGWMAWPRPAIDIAIAPGGRATVVGRFGQPRPLPETLVVARGGRPRVRIRNADTTGHSVGIFSAPARETAEFTLPGPGRYTGECSVHPKAQLTVVVR